MGSILIRGGRIVTMNPEREIFEGDIYVKGERIEAVGRSLGGIKADKVIDARGKIVMPGLIQTHVHLTQTLFRGLADDMELMDWLQKRIWPLEAAHDAESNYYSAKLALAELIKGGTTSIVDMETVNYTDEAINAIYESGIRAITGKCMMDCCAGAGMPSELLEDTRVSIAESLRLLKKWHMKDGGRIRYAFAPRFVISCTEELLEAVRDMAEEYDTAIHTHASENIEETQLVEKAKGMRNISYLHKIGLTGPRMILAHCIWIDNEEMAILAGTGTNIAHCPSSNLKLASGIASIPELLSMGAHVSLGADGAPCNNNLNAFHEMRMAALIQKPRLLNPTAMPAEKVLELATLGGARAMGQESEIGSLEAGKRADIIIVDPDKHHIAPASMADLPSMLVYAATAHDVNTTIVNGKILMKNRELRTLDEKDIIRNCNKIIQKQVQRSGISYDKKL